SQSPRNRVLPTRAQRLTASKVWTLKKIAPTARYILCSTPYGIKGLDTPIAITLSWLALLSGFASTNELG
ncbi:MAG: hypothetical protein WCD18_08820, partial [Thermosynechococcaceae cyanobacterium]